MSFQQNEDLGSDDAVELWRMKKLLHNLQDARGNGTSLISLHLPPKEQISRVQKMLREELGTAGNIKSHANKVAVQSAIKATQNRLRL
eukprot:2609696-Rhodomonas_salina.1